MPSPQPIPQRIAVLVYRGSSDGRPQADEIAEFLRKQGPADVVWGEFHDPALEQRVSRGEFDLLIALGGDGTMLRAGKLGALAKTPVLGINLGKFGFLAELQGENWRSGMRDLLAGRYWLEERMLLQCRHRRREELLDDSLVVNDLVVCRGSIVRPIRVRATVDGHLLSNYVADGVIASTPTGSTAYALAAGGPLLPPELRNMLILPIAPHLTMDRAVVLSQGACVELAVYTDHEAVLSADGRLPIPMQSGDTVSIEASSLNMQFVHFQDPGYFYRKISAHMARNPSAGSA